jgi:uncharacterized protein YfiM (DUF2279 family)
VIALAVAAVLSTSPAVRPEDRWFAEDKWRHFVTSFVSSSLAGSAARAAGLDRGQAIRAGVAAGATVGVWKEVQDARRPGGHFSVRDLVWDAAGVGAAAGVLSGTR